MYHPTDPTPQEILAGFNDEEFFEYLELENVGVTSLDLTDIRFTKGIDFDFINSPITTLNPGQMILVVRNAAAFEMRYGKGHAIAGEWDPNDKLNNSSDRIKLAFGGGDTIRDFTYLDEFPWPEKADGTGRSLTLRDPYSVPNHALPNNWRASYSPTGTPGTTEMESLFAQWLLEQGGSDPNAPYQQSSLSSLLAFALAVDLQPQAPPESFLPGFHLIELEGSSYPALTFRVRQPPNPFNYLVEVSNDLGTWSSGPDHVEEVGSAVENDDGTMSRTFRALSPTKPGRKDFMRLRVTHP